MTTIVELERIARDLVPPVGMTAVAATVEVEACSRIGTGDRTYPSGLVVDADGTHRAPRTSFGVAWVIDGRRRSKPIASFDRQADAFDLIDLLRTGSTSRSARRSVAEAGLARLGPAEGRAVQDAEARASAPVSAQPSPAVVGAELVSSSGRKRSVRATSDGGAGSLPGTHSTIPGATPGSELAVGAPPPSLEPVADATAGPTPAVASRCKACGMSLEGRGPGQGRARETCDDACRQAFRRGARAPEPGVVDEAFTARLSRLPKPAHEVMDQDQLIAFGLDHP